MCIQRCTKITNTLLTLVKRVAKLEQLVYLLDYTLAQVEEQLKQILFRDMGDVKPKARPDRALQKSKDKKDSSAASSKAKKTRENTAHRSSQ